mmetsp:Transcript_14261/g.24904  ORF Transcript_14261/g.24904 Transcript_14261/m.24904 type:complete len:161 (-) Transcript_14261:1374-1856(-)
MGFIDSIKAAVTGEENEAKTLLGQVDSAVTLSWKQRIIGFGCCFGLGMLLSILAIAMLWSLNITKFVIFYTAGSVLSVCSTMFLMGPIKQCQRMFEAQRAIATSVYLATIVATLVLALKTGNAGICLIMFVIQTLALTWYCLTWIPGGMTAVKAMIGISS